MLIGGFMPLSLIDFPGTPAAVIFTQGCNWRCRYCHNNQLIPKKAKDLYAEEKVLSLLERRKGLLQGVVITGGEPTLQADLIVFMEKIKSMGFKVKLDTNGTNPDLLEQVLSENAADFIAMDIKASREKYGKIIGCVPDMACISRSIRLIANSGISHQFRTTFDTSILRQEDLEKIKGYLPENSSYVVQKCRYGKN
ncbi:MAG: anaerobic ribonucleoside-triphosphate reductase activating protein [Deltaproteobacteria bacterium]|nr:MAG: anaerobic ribonucleoside-triphosphate reductase activating protein [Deltaproteobacteria bacterium]